MGLDCQFISHDGNFCHQDNTISKTMFDEDGLHLSRYGTMKLMLNVCGNILDLLFVNDESRVDQVAAMDVDFTADHTVLNFIILLKMSEKPSVSRKVFN